MVFFKLKDGTYLIGDDNGKVLHFPEKDTIKIKEIECNELSEIRKNDLYLNFIISNYGEIEKMYTELESWEPKSFIFSDEFINLINKIFWFKTDDLRQFSIYLKMMKDSKSFNVSENVFNIEKDTPISNGKTITLFFKPADILLQWDYDIPYQNKQGIKCNKEITLDQLEMILYILKKEMQCL